MDDGDGSGAGAGDGEFDEPPVTGVLYQLLDDLLPSPEETTGVRSVVGGVMSVANHTDSLELLRSGRNASLDIFCDKEAQVSRTSDPEFLGRRMVYVILSPVVPTPVHDTIGVL